MKKDKKKHNYFIPELFSFDLAPLRVTILLEGNFRMPLGLITAYGPLSLISIWIERLIVFSFTETYIEYQNILGIKSVFISR